MKPNQVGADDLYFTDFVVQDLRTLGTVEAELHILGGEGIAVMEGQPLTQVKFVHPLIGAHRPGLSQAGGHEIARHGLDDGIVQSIEHPKRRDQAHHLTRIEPGWGQGHV
jgi:hypothetical protein